MPTQRDMRCQTLYADEIGPISGLYDFGSCALRDRWSFSRFRTPMTYIMPCAMLSFQRDRAQCRYTFQRVPRRDTAGASYAAAGRIVNYAAITRQRVMLKSDAMDVTLLSAELTRVAGRHGALLPPASPRLKNSANKCCRKYHFTTAESAARRPSRRRQLFWCRYGVRCEQTMSDDALAAGATILMRDNTRCISLRANCRVALFLCFSSRAIKFMLATDDIIIHRKSSASGV